MVVGSEPVLDELQAIVRRLDRRSRRYSQLRLTTFGVLVAGIAVMAWSTALSLVLAIPAGAAFVVAVAKHERTRSRLCASRARQELREEREARRRIRRSHRTPPFVPCPALPLESGRGTEMFDGAGDASESPLEAGVADDLNLLEGPRTLYGFLDISSTVFGGWWLRRFLMAPLCSAGVIRSRQEAVRELAEAGSYDRLLEDLHPLRAHDFRSVPATLRGPFHFAERTLLRVLAGFQGTLAPASLVALFFWRPAAAMFVIVAVSNLSILAHWGSRVRSARQRLRPLMPLLAGLERVYGTLSAERMASPRLRGLCDRWEQSTEVARRLHGRLRVLELRELGFLSELVNLLTLWELRALPLVERTLRESRPTIERAIAALGELEALLCLAAPLKEQPDFTLPEVLEGPSPRIEGEEMGHPLLEPSASVRNPVALDDRCRIALITGSNMAGKSTYLKAVGVNLILAAMGGPVCATRWRWTPGSIYTDVNIRDSLDDGQSYFQVEVERVRAITEASRRTRHLVAIFDELFRGTNSTEREAIALAVLRYLRGRGVLVLAATHDLRLAAAVAEESHMANLHFRYEVDGGEMRFDYRLRPGPAKTRNAIRVLRDLGYDPAIIADATERCALAETEGGATNSE